MGSASREFRRMAAAAMVVNRGEESLLSSLDRLGRGSEIRRGYWCARTARGWPIYRRARGMGSGAAGHVRRRLWRWAVSTGGGGNTTSY